MLTIRTKLLRESASLPTYGSGAAAGADLRACLDAPVTIAPGQTVLIPTGVAMEIPLGYAGLVYARSGLSVKRDLAPANKVGVIDADYRGEIFVPLHNHGKEPQTVEHGERIAQMIITACPASEFVQSDELSDTARGEGGFGSTGNK